MEETAYRKFQLRSSRRETRDHSRIEAGILLLASETCRLIQGGGIVRINLARGCFGSAQSRLNCTVGDGLNP